MISMEKDKPVGEKETASIRFHSIRFTRPLLMIVPLIVMALVFTPGMVLVCILAEIIMFLLLVPGVAHAYTVRFGPAGPCHEIITGKAIDLLEKEAKIRNLPHWEEIRVFRQKLMEGARDEDYFLDKVPGEPAQEDESVKLMHYYNPISGKPLPDDFPVMDTGDKNQEKHPLIQVSAIQRGMDHESKLMKAYESGNFEKVYWYLGRICHLLQDLTVPAHVHGDLHWLDFEDDFENQVDYYARSGRMRNYSITNHYFMKLYRRYREREYGFFKDLLPAFMHNTAFHSYLRSLFKLENMLTDPENSTKERSSFIRGTSGEQDKKRNYLADKNKKRLYEDEGNWRQCAEKPGYVYVKKVTEVIPFYWRELNKHNLSLWDLYYNYFVGWAINSTAALLMLWYEMIPRLETVLENRTVNEDDPVCHTSFRVRNLGGIREKIVIDLEDIPPYISPVLRQKKRPLRRDLHNTSRFELELDPGEDAKIDLEFSGNPVQ